MRMWFQCFFAFALLSPASIVFADVATCDRSKCEGGTALVYSPTDEPAIACDDLSVCSYVSFYLLVDSMVKAGEANENDPQNMLVLERKMRRAGLASFQDAANSYRWATHRQRVKINIMNFKEELAYVEPVQGGKGYWISFESLTPIARTAKEYPFAGKITRASAIMASLVNAGTGVYGAKSIAREIDAVLPQSFDERISFSLEGHASGGGQIFICSSKKFCDSIHGYFTLLTSLAGPYLFRSKDGKIVAQLNSSLPPDAALLFESALLRIK